MNNMRKFALRQKLQRMAERGTKHEREIALQKLADLGAGPFYGELTADEILEMENEAVEVEEPVSVFWHKGKVTYVWADGTKDTL